jgi:hypothetical protein
MRIGFVDVASESFVTLRIEPELSRRPGHSSASVVHRVRILLTAFTELSGKAVAVVRRLEMKHKAPLMGRMMFKATVAQQETEQVLNQVRSKGKGLIGVGVQVVDVNGTSGLIGRVEWFVQEPCSPRSA